MSHVFYLVKNEQGIRLLHSDAGDQGSPFPDWLHEIKYDGYRLRLERDGDRVRLITKGGYNWTDRYPWIIEAALKNRHRQFVIDGEAVVLGVDGIADFNALHRAGTRTRFSFMPSTSWRSTVMICVDCRCPCARRTCAAARSTS